MDGLDIAESMELFSRLSDLFLNGADRPAGEKQTVNCGW